MIQDIKARLERPFGRIQTRLRFMPLPQQKQIDAAVEVLQARAQRPQVGVILGSGLGSFGEALGSLVKIPYSEVPGMPDSAVAGHAGTFCAGELGGTQVLCMQGRVHGYEGHPVERVVFGACLLAAAGCTQVLITNAAGGIAEGLQPGDLMLITDHLNLTGQNPLIGAHDGRGPRFLDMTQAYDVEMRSAAERVAEQNRIPIRSGIYAGLMGPTYETPAEVRMLAALGASAVGMSTVLEVIALRQLGVRVGAVSCITNLAAGLSQTSLSHAEVESTAAASRDGFISLLSSWISEISR